MIGVMIMNKRYINLAVSAQQKQAIDIFRGFILNTEGIHLNRKDFILYCLKQYAKSKGHDLKI